MLRLLRAGAEVGGRSRGQEQEAGAGVESRNMGQRQEQDKDMRAGLTDGHRIAVLLCSVLMSACCLNLKGL